MCVRLCKARDPAFLSPHRRRRRRLFSFASFSYKASNSKPLLRARFFVVVVVNQANESSKEKLNCLFRV